MKFFQESLQRAAGASDISPGTVLRLRPDLLLAHDGTWPKVHARWKAAGYARATDARFLITLDHAFPAPTIEDRVMHRQLAQICRDHQCELYSHGEGNLHQVLAERIEFTPGMILVGADGHVATSGAFGAIAFSVSGEDLAAVLETGTYPVTVPDILTLELTGQLNEPALPRDIALHLLGNFHESSKGKAVALRGTWIDQATPAERMTVCNLLPEGGAVTAFLPPRDSEVEGSLLRVDISTIEPMAAIPPSPTHVRPIRELTGQPITVAFLGGCSSGRIEDMRIAAKVLAGQTIPAEITLIVTPASRQVADEMDRSGISNSLHSAGAVIMPPGCGACPGRHFGLLSAEDIAISTTIRNSPGRIGDKEAQIYLASPWSVAQAALHGSITLPDPASSTGTLEVSRVSP